MSIDTMSTASACATCPVNRHMARLGVNIDNWDYVVGLAGNPNTGKSTVFNSLTGLRQHTGNWPGKTVARAEGGYEYDNKRYKLVDLPGTYSLLAASVDEEIARDFILFGQPDVTAIVVDATRLERNLNLALQVLEITDKAVICLNLIDEARRHGLTVDDRRLARDLGVPVIPMSARQGEGIAELLSAINDMAQGRVATRPHRIGKTHNAAFDGAIDTLVAQIETAYPGLPNARWVALRLLDGDEQIERAIRDGSLGDLSKGDRTQAVAERLMVAEIPAR
ncbi:FeoB small GTPase domain-containing protein [Aggregatilinea lenta]|uniref:FeoB small GTPase domain-containing protein n=1 Tax=Aggregatilinea lenta TaxID=913108 RepID=UPI001EE9627C|nr:FeoB small GTPase domain-containing protein [Aggregatilinea lenta]